MTSKRPEEQSSSGMPAPEERRAGLCYRCAHREVVPSARGSLFYLCRLSYVDSRFPKYPPLPVLRCDGFAPGANHG